MAGGGGEEWRRVLRERFVIFVTVGTQLGFDRLIGWMDEICAQHQIADVHAQIGSGHYLPRYMTWEREVSPADFPRMIDRADMVVAHAGMGTIISTRLASKPIAIVPRIAALGEHRNEHQLATSRKFAGVAGCHVVTDKAGLTEALRVARPEFPSGGALQHPSGLEARIRQLLQES